MNETTFKDKMLKDFRSLGDYWFKYPAGPRGGSIPDLIGSRKQACNEFTPTAIEAKCIDTPAREDTPMLPFKELTLNQRNEILKMTAGGWDCWVAILIRPSNRICWLKYAKEIQALNSNNDPVFFRKDVVRMTDYNPYGFPHKYRPSPVLKHKKDRR